MRNPFFCLLAYVFIMPCLGHAQPLVVGDDQWDSTDIYFPESLESIIFPPNPRWEDLGRIPESSFFRRASTPVGRLKVRRSDGVALCTAFLVSRDKILTNNHCIPGGGDVSDAVIELGYYTQGAEIDRYSVILDPVVTDIDLDISLLSLEVDADPRWDSIDFSYQSIEPGEDLFVIHHPGGQTMKLSRVGCFSGPARGLPKGHFLHQCDTIGGSSGSPIFNMDGLVVGIHHRGTPDRGPEAYNRGTQISDALAFLNVLKVGGHSPNNASDQNAVAPAMSFRSMEDFSFKESTCSNLASYRGSFDGDMNGLRAYVAFLSCYTKRYELTDSEAIGFEDNYNFISNNSIFKLVSCDEIMDDIRVNRIDEWTDSEFLFSANCDLSKFQFAKVRLSARPGKEGVLGQNDYYIWLNAFDPGYWDETDRAILAEVEQGK